MRLGAAHLDPYQSLLMQQLQAVAVELQLAEQAVGDTVRMLRQCLERVALARGAGQAWVVDAGAFVGQPVALLAGFGRLALA